MQSSKPRRAFTLIELLVVIAIIAVLIALLLPAVQAAREAARRAQCVNNLKQLGLAMMNYESTNTSFAPGRKGCCWGTWVVFVLPFLEQGNMYSSWNFTGSPQWDPSSPMFRYNGVANSTLTNTRISAFTCPSDTPNTQFNGIQCYNYAVNFGNTANAQQTTLNGINFGGAPFTDMISSANGGATTGQSGVVTIAGVSDGTSNTVMASEVIIGQGVDLRGFIHWGDASGFESYLAPNSKDFDRIYSASYVKYPYMTNPPGAVSTTTAPNMVAARSRHSGGVNTAMCDGSVRFMKDSISLPIWQALSTTKGGEVISADAY